MAHKDMARLARNGIFGLGFIVAPLLGWAGCGGGTSTGTGGASTTGGSGTCGEGATLCGDACTVTDIDPENCGACGTKCEAGQVCSAGECAVSCPAALTECSGGCVDAQHDPANCGSCGTTCVAGEVCSAGVCGLQCAGGTTKCGNICVNTDFDPGNCGSCGTICAAGEVCSAGVCDVQCTGGTDLCGGLCVNTQKDPANCGACGTACAPGEVCSAGVCGVQCGSGTTLCNGSCVDTDFDPANCGGCGIGCPAGQVCSAGACGLQCGGGTTKCGNLCVNTNLDPANCGGCGIGCPAGQSCVASVCGLVCVGGTTKCGNACVSLQNDPANCGSCGFACSAGNACVAGACSPLAQTHATLAYVHNDTSPGSITAYSIAANGALTQIAGSPFATGGSSGFNHHSDGIEICGNFLYDVNSVSNTISGFTIGANGVLTALPGSPFVANSTPLGIACTGNNAFLYATDVSTNVWRYSIAANGALAQLGQTAAGGSTIGLTLNAATNRLFAAGFGSNLTVYNITPATGVLTAAPGSPLNTGGTNHSASVSPDGLFVATEGNNNVRIWSVGAGGAVAAVAGSPFPDPSACEVVGLAWAPNSKRLFVGHRGCTPGTVTVYDVAANGSLTLVAGSPFLTGGNQAVGLAVDFDGSRLFVTHISSNLTSVMNVAANGALSQVAGSPFANPATGNKNWVVLR